MRTSRRAVSCLLKAAVHGCCCQLVGHFTAVWASGACFEKQSGLIKRGKAFSVSTEAASEVDRRRPISVVESGSCCDSACCLVQYDAGRPVVFRASAGPRVPRWLRSFLILVCTLGEIMMWAHLCLFSVIISLLDEHEGYFSHHAFTFKSYGSPLTVVLWDSGCKTGVIGWKRLCLVSTSDILTWNKSK